jgi:hypothetical protein
MNNLRSSLGPAGSIRNSDANRSIPQNISQQNMDLDIIDEKVVPSYPKTPQTQSNNLLSKKRYDNMMDTEDNIRPPQPVNDDDEFDVPDEESNLANAGDVRSL